MRTIRDLAIATRYGGRLKQEEKKRIAAILDEVSKLMDVCADSNVSCEAIGIRVRNTSWESSVITTQDRT